MTSTKCAQFNIDRTLAPGEAVNLQTEKGFTNTVVEYAKSQGWRVYRTWTSIHSPAGFPDLTLVRAEADTLFRLVFLECKSEKGKVTMAQKEWLGDLNRVRGRVEAHVVRPSMWAFIERILRR